MAEQLDPEVVHQLIDGCFERITAEVHRFEGTINQYTGDGVMALFGAPIAHDDGSRRAVHAALGMQRALREYGQELQAERRLALQMRIGINTGPVVVGKIGDDLRMDYTAVGDTTNLAARLQQNARPGSVVISKATHTLVAGLFQTLDLGEVAVKGRAPARAFEVLMDSVATVPLLLMLIYRIRYTPPFGSRNFHTTLPLRSLPEAESLVMAGHILGSELFPEELQTTLMAKAEGVLLFIEEVTKTLLAERAMEYNDQALILALALHHRAFQAVCLANRAWIRSVAYGQILESVRDAEEAFRLSEEIGDPRLLAQTLVFHGGVLQWRAEFDRSLARLSEAATLSGANTLTLRSSSAAPGLSWK